MIFFLILFLIYANNTYFSHAMVKRTNAAFFENAYYGVFLIKAIFGVLARLFLEI